MKRQAVSGGKWFDMDAAESWSDRTNNDWRWQTLFRTANGKFVLGHISCVDGERDRFESLSEDEACQWIIENGRELPADLMQVAAEREV